jgi:CheY-like chemotaxis protein/predicted transcriptional regulator
MIDQLGTFGLTETQVKVYVLLLQFGRTSVAKVARKVGVHRAEVYRILRQLVEKEVVTESKKIRPVMFTAVAPEKAVNILLQQQTKRLEQLKEKAPALVAWLDSQAGGEWLKASVLLVDDDEFVRRTLTRALVKAGFKVDTAPDGKTGQEKSRLSHYDVALLDLRLPDMDGITLIESLRERNPDLKEIIITGYPSLQNAAAAVDKGANAFIVKPVKPADLIVKIREKLQCTSS